MRSARLFGIGGEHAGIIRRVARPGSQSFEIGHRWQSCRFSVSGAQANRNQRTV
jgi:hypothetical protein